MRLSATTLARRVDAHGEQGFTMIATMLALFVVGLLSVAAIAAANGDIRFSRYDQDDKQAVAAAEAGINDYFAHLQQDPDYWTRCAGEDSINKPLPANTAVNQAFTGTPPATRRWRDVPDSGSRYSIELIPAPGQTTCDVNNATATMLGSGGNLRVRATGNVKGSNNYKAVVATFRRTSFLDYIYFTDLENQDPTYLTLNFGGVQTRATDANGNPTPGSPDLATWAAEKCERHWWGTQAGGDGRGEKPAWHGQYYTNGAWTTSTGFDITTDWVCGEITFADADQVKGPFHSNDDILVSGTPEFGRTGNQDKVEVANISDSDTGWRYTGANPLFRTPDGKLSIKAPTLDLPPSNSAIKSQARDNYLYTGPTTIKLNTGGTMDVTTGGSTTTGVAMPSNGVIYVQNSTCTYGFKPKDTSYVDPGCGQVKVSGTYSKDLTIAAEDDVIVTNNLKRDTSSNAVLGLIAKNFVRVWHPVDRAASGCPNQAGSVSNIQIDAALLSLAHSFTVDNYDCGASLGNLTINGAIAQKHRGIVGTGGGTGYIKDYNYDDRLKYRSPPFFLDPVQASWRILRENEQSGAR